MFSENVKQAARNHARREYPKESCGLVVAGNYVPCTNVRENPEEEFKIEDKVWAMFRATGRVEAIVHSHPDGPLCPSVLDQEQQLAMPTIPWGIVFLDKIRTKGPVFWGDTLPIPPLEGRPWMMGVWDCYGLVRDYYRLKGIILPNKPRMQEWWLDKKQEAMLLNNFPEFGFREITLAQIQPDDVLLIRFPEFKVATHCAVYIGNNLALHHRWDRPSTKLPIGPFMSLIDKVLRHESR